MVNGTSHQPQQTATATIWNVYRFPKPKVYWYDPIFTGSPRQNSPPLMDLKFDHLHKSRKDTHVLVSTVSTKSPLTSWKHAALRGLPRENSDETLFTPATALIPELAPVFKYAKMSITRKMSDILRVLVVVVIIAVDGQLCCNQVFKYFSSKQERKGLGIDMDPLFLCYNNSSSSPSKNGSFASATSQPVSTFGFPRLIRWQSLSTRMTRFELHEWSNFFPKRQRQWKVTFLVTLKFFIHLPSLCGKNSS